MKLFFWFVKAQGRWPLVPKISFADNQEAGSPRPEVAEVLG